jgi:1,4-alpha-glucan branching enzyme
MRKVIADDGAVAVTFSLPQAWTAEHQAAVCGDFNEWAIDAHVLSPTDDGRLATTVLLPPGRYEFRYRLDNQVWINDPEADDYALNEHGGHNSVVDTRPTVTSTAPPADRERATVT